MAKVLRKPNSTGLLIRWSIELSEFNLEYQLKKVIKGQTLADFIAKIGDFPQEKLAGLTKNIVGLLCGRLVLPSRQRIGHTFDWPKRSRASLHSYPDVQSHK